MSSFCRAVGSFLEFTLDGDEVVSMHCSFNWKSSVKLNKKRKGQLSSNPHLVMTLGNGIY